MTSHRTTGATQPASLGPSASLSMNQGKKSGGWSRTYLIGYNLGCAAAWSIVLGRLLFHLLLTKHLPRSLAELFTRAGHAHECLSILLITVQSSALLEVLHASLGLVRSGLLTTVMQVASRLGIVWFILPVFPKTAHCPLYSSMVLAWSLSEIIRDATYASALLKYPLRPLLWLRYSAFYLLYPLGAGSEWALIILAYRMSREADGTSMSGLSYFLLTALAVWPPALFMMMRHMSTQRKKFIATQYPRLSNPEKQQ